MPHLQGSREERGRGFEFDALLLRAVQKIGSGQMVVGGYSLESLDEGFEAMDFTGEPN